MARQAYTRYHEEWKLPGDSTWSRWEGQDRNRRSIELDIVASLDDERTLVGGIRWSSRPVGPELHWVICTEPDEMGADCSGERTHWPPSWSYAWAVGRTTISPTSTSAGCSMANAIARAIASGGSAIRSRAARSWLLTSELVMACTKSV